jgi:SNF2 family DNA or RNA helicase
MVSINTPTASIIDRSKFKELNYVLKPYQREFINIYAEKKQKYRLNGYILAFEQGLGKTFTSLALMHSLDKDCVIIIAPKNTTKVVWQSEINTIFNKNKTIWMVGDKPKRSRFYIVNYESIEKLKQIYKYILSSKNIGIIVDESHNFKDINALRVKRLLSLIKDTQSNDVLFMSGTPIKALGSEMMPILKSIDPIFDDESLAQFKRVFGYSVPVALDVLKNRLGLMMHRKMKSEVIKLPKKEEKEIYIKIPNADKYILENVKKKVLIFISERKKFYKENYFIFEKNFDDVINFCEKKLNYTTDPDWIKYKKIVARFHSRGYSASVHDIKNAKWANHFERAKILPYLPSEKRKDFVKAKSVVKYVDLTIMGEVIGGLLNKMRSEMYSEMLLYSGICDIINQSKKKTVCFTTFVDVAEQCFNVVKRKCNNDPLIIYGKTSSNVTGILKDFSEDDTKNPLIATIQTLATGVTLIEASTVIFINKPWRYTDYLQASDRVHRIGQDTDVEIYTFILDTGDRSNLSTRMEDILNWSKEMFSGIVGEEVVGPMMNKVIDKYLK